MDQNFAKFNRISSSLYNYKLIDSKSPITKRFISLWIFTTIGTLTPLFYSTLSGYEDFQRVKFGDFLVGLLYNAEIVNFCLFCINLNHNFIILLSIHNSYAKPRDHQYFLDFLRNGFLYLKKSLQNLILKLFWLSIVISGISGTVITIVLYGKLIHMFQLLETEKLWLIIVSTFYILISIQIWSYANINSVIIAIICKRLKVKFSSVRIRLNKINFFLLPHKTKFLLESFNDHCLAIKKLDKTMKFLLFTTISLSIPSTGIFLIIPITSKLSQMMTFVMCIIPTYFFCFISALMICCCSVNNQIIKVHTRLCSLAVLTKNRYCQLKLNYSLKRFNRLEQLTMNDIPITYQLYAEVSYVNLCSDKLTRSQSYL